MREKDKEFAKLVEQKTISNLSYGKLFFSKADDFRTKGNICPDPVSRETLKDSLQEYYKS